MLMILMLPEQWATSCSKQLFFDALGLLLLTNVKGICKINQWFRWEVLYMMGSEVINDEMVLGILTAGLIILVGGYFYIPDIIQRKIITSKLQQIQKS